MKLFLYGGGKPDKNNKFNQVLAELLRDKNLKVGYIPSSGDKTRKYFKEFKERFGEFGFKNFTPLIRKPLFRPGIEKLKYKIKKPCSSGQGLTGFIFLSLEEEYGEKIAKDIMNSDAIYLSGGNTYHFLWWLKKRKFLSRIKNFVKKGGVLIGSSAGSILMTPNINTSGIPHWDCDKNKIGLKNFKSLGLVNFEFFPHYIPSQKLDKELTRYSKTTHYPVFAFKEGGGIIVWDEQIKIIGYHKIFYQGNVIKLN